jgi:putative oxidoreductase
MRERILALLRIGLGATFVYAAAVKLPDMAAFAEDVANYRLLPAALVPAFGSSLVGVELLAGLALVAGVAARGAALVLSGLMLAFVGAVSQALLRGIDLRCGCFGGAAPASWWTVGRDLLILAGALAVLLLGPGRLLPRRSGAS